MVVTGERFIIPTKVEWLAMFLMIGLFGFFAQASGVVVRCSLSLTMEADSFNYGTATGDSKSREHGYLHSSKGPLSPRTIRSINHLISVDCLCEHP